MSEALELLVAETTRLTGAELPPLLRDDAPTLTLGTDEIYLVGLIGGKDVGKSSLINALAGVTLSPSSSFGPGTERAIAYVHQDSVTDLRLLLGGLPAEQIELRPHAIAGLRRQVLVDLPDIDSQYADHAELTRKMLRHILFPIWLQSVEKYADQTPARLLAAVAEGNDAKNFIFGLSKADQVAPEAASEIASDYAQRLRARLNLAEPPTVLLISSVFPDRFDLPRLRQMLQTQRSSAAVEHSSALAQQRQASTLRGWLLEQRLDQRSAAAGRTLTQAEELLADRIATPLLETALPAIIADPARRLWLTESAIDARLARWPIVSMIQSLVSPLIALLRSNLNSRAGPRATSIDSIFARSLGRPLDQLLQSAFAHFKQVNPSIGEALTDRPIWESAAAALAISDLDQRLEAVSQQQRAAIVSKLSGSAATVLFAPLRWLATIGVLLWFPLVQPILSRYFNEGLLPGWHDLAKVLIPLLGAAYLLHCAAFLLIWFVTLWGWLVWRTQRRVKRWIECWSRVDAPPELSLSASTLTWMEDLLRPLHDQHAQADSLARRVAAALG